MGPIGILCIRRTLAEGRLTGFVSGLGAASADALYGAVAGFGLTFVAGALTGSQTWLRLGGAVFLCWLGARTFVAKPAAGAAPATARGLVGAYASTLALTLTNPATILSFVAVFAGLGVARGSYVSASALVAGVFAGSALWWLLLSGGVGLCRSRVRPTGLVWINRLSGATIAGFGVLALLSVR